MYLLIDRGNFAIAIYRVILLFFSLLFFFFRKFHYCEGLSLKLLNVKTKADYYHWLAMGMKVDNFDKRVD